MLEYYYAHLQDIVNYSDLKVEVFQDFRCLGNTILFFLLLEQAMVRMRSLKVCLIV